MWAEEDILNIQKRSFGSGLLGRIGIDVDETMFPLLPHFVAWHNHEYGTDVEISQFINYSAWSSVFDVSLETIIERYMLFMYDFYRGLNLKPFFGCEETLIKLRDEGAHIMVVTSRQSELAALTIRQLFNGFNDNWLFKGYSYCNKYSRDPDNIGFSEKWETCKRMDVKLMVEDNIKDTEALVEHGVSVILFNHNGEYPWSATEHSHPMIRVATNWLDVHPLALQMLQEMQPVAV